MTKKELKRIKKLSKKKGELYAEKKPKVKMKTLYEITISNFDFYIIEMILHLNFIPEKEYLFANNGGTIVEDDFKFNKKFKQKSALNWDKASDINSPLFRSKFLTQLLFWILNNDETIIENVVDLKEPEKPNWIRRGVLKTIIVKLNTLVTNFLAKDCSYAESLFDVIELINLEKCSNGQAKINQRFIEQTQLVKDYFNGVGDISEAMLWHTILRLAYIMVDGKQNLGDIPKFREDLNPKNPDEIKEIVGRLGIALIVNKNKKKVSPVYKIWEKSDAMIFSKFDDADELVELKEGTKALYYLAFLIDMPEFTKYISMYV